MQIIPLRFRCFRRNILLSLFVLTLLSACSSGGYRTVITFSDVHFNPFYDTSLFAALDAAPADDWADIFEGSSVTDPVTWGEESDYNLLVAAIDSACNQADETPFTIFGGDILRHDFIDTFYTLYGSVDETAMKAFMYKTVEFFADQVRSNCSTIPVVITLGNNDAYEGDYQIEPAGDFLSDTSALFYETLLREKVDEDDFLSTYRAGGYYACDLLGGGLRVIVLNSILFSPNAASGTEAAANTQLDWFESELASAVAARKRVWVVMHIPPGADIYSTVSTYMDDSGQVSDASMMWQTSYQNSYNEIVTEYSPFIDMTFTGHAHMDEYRLTNENGIGLHGSVIGMPSIAPFFGNNPGFKTVVIANEEWTPLNYYSYYDPLSAASPEFEYYYSFFDSYAYQYNSYGYYYDNTVLDALFSELISEFSIYPTKRSLYIDYYYASHTASNPITDVNWKAYKCGITKMVKADYISCINSGL